MHNIETSLVRIVSKEASQKHPDDMKVALAGIMGQSITFTQDNVGYLMGICFGWSNRREFDAALSKRRNLAINKSVAWILKRRSGVWFIFFGKENVISETEAKKELKKFFGEQMTTE